MAEAVAKGTMLQIATRRGQRDLCLLLLENKVFARICCAFVFVTVPCVLQADLYVKDGLGWVASSEKDCGAFDCHFA
jgi:hypothetical protein